MRWLCMLCVDLGGGIGDAVFGDEAVFGDKAVFSDKAVFGDRRHFQ